MAKLNESLTVHLLLVSGSKKGVKYFASLYVGVCEADQIGQTWTAIDTFLRTLQEPYIIPGLVPTSFRCFRVCSDMLSERASFLQILLCFSSLVLKLKQLSSFKAIF